MLLVVDVGNTQTHVGLMEAGVLIDDWRIATVRHRTGDEIAGLLHGLPGAARDAGERRRSTRSASRLSSRG